MNVLVTGATGFVGSAVAWALLKRGHTVIGLVRDRAKGRLLEEQGAVLAEGTMERPESYKPLVARVDAVIHAAQAKPRGRWSRRKIAHMHRTDALMTRTLAGQCLKQGKRLVYSSGAMAHLAAGDEWINEATPLRPCLLAKGHAEMVAELAGVYRQRGLDVVIVTPGFVCGAGGFLQETVDLLRRGQYRVIGRGDNYWSLVDVEDLAEAYALALERGRAGDNYFVSDDKPLRRREVIDRVTDVLGLPRVGTAPCWVVGLWLGFPLVEAITAPIRMRNQFVKERLGWKPRYDSLIETLPSMLARCQPL
jgi:nucleoside-diphosphate-sugar epimerase